jgi:Bacterial Ig-like domain
MAADLQLVVKSADGTTETVRYKPGAKHAGRPATEYRLLVDGSEALPAGTRIIRRGRDLVVNFAEGEPFEILQWIDVEGSRLATGGAQALNADSGTYISALEVLSGESQLLSAAVQAIGILGEEGWLAGALDSAAGTAGSAAGTTTPTALSAGLLLAALPVLAISRSAAPGDANNTAADSPSVTVKNIDLTTATDSGTSSADNLTGNAFPGFTLVPFAAGLTPNLYVDGVLFASVFDPATHTLTALQPIAEGARQISYTLTDSDGIETSQGPSLTLVIDTTAPHRPGWQHRTQRLGADRQRRRHHPVGQPVNSDDYRSR